MRPRAVAVEAAVVAALGGALTAASLALLVLDGGAPHIAVGGLPTLGAAGLATAVVARAMVRLHRRWRGPLGRYTAAAVLCAIAAVAAALVVSIPGQCPGDVLPMGRCGVREAAAWGQAGGLATAADFLLAGLVAALVRTVRDLVRDGSAQGGEWIAALWAAVRRRRAAGRSPERRVRGGPKGRPTPRRADAERLRRARLRARG
jgi:hypothetical protein